MKPDTTGAGSRLIDRWTAIREPLGRGRKIVLGVIPIVLLIGAWAWVTHGAAEERLISPLILPAPLEVVHSLHSLWFGAELSRSLAASAGRVIGGFLVAVLVVLPLGVLMGAFGRVRALFQPLVVFGAYLPIPTLVPLSMSLFGIGETQKIMFLAVAFMVFLLPMIIQALDGVDEVYIQTAQTLGASRAQIVRHVLLGVSMAPIFDAMRLCFGIGWTYIILAEMVAADRGLGQIIIVAQRRGPREHIYLVLLVIVLIAFATDKIWLRAGRAFFPHRSER